MDLTKIVFVSIFIPVYLLISFLSVYLLKGYFDAKTLSKYSFKRYFSFEIHNFINNDQYLVFLRIFYLIGVFSPLVVTIYYVSSMQFNRPLHIYMMICCIFLLITMISRLFLFVTKTLNPNLFTRTFLINYFSTFSEFVIFLLGLIVHLNTTIEPSYFGVNIAYILVLAIVIFIMILMLFNKKIYSWYKLEKDEKGNYDRPKILWLATYDWILYLINILFVVIFAIYLIFLI